MSNPIGNDAQSVQDEEDREGELLCLKIKAQLEDLFSCSHLAEDGFLLKHVQKNKQGYVSLKLLTCLKKVKRDGGRGEKKIKVLTTDWYMTLAGAAYSDILEVSDDCTKVKRRETLPEWLLCSPTSKLLLVWNISVEWWKNEGGPEHPSLYERILQKFSAHGNVTSLWILHPGKELPKELKCYAKRHNKLGQDLCAVVKFDKLEAVRKVCSALKAEEETSNGEGMRVVPLGFLPVHHIARDNSSEENNEDQSAKSWESPPETSEDLVQEESSSSVPNETPDTSQPRESSDNSTQRTSEQISTSCNGQSFFGLHQRYSRAGWSSVVSDKDGAHIPWVLRRKFAASALNPKVAGHPYAPCLMQRVLRQPFGPDGTKGFQGRRKPL